ncbi:STAS domain-containing protein [Streptomyces sp. TRM66268-LWL]|uniref:Anti-sigma factor antagonist n=1 Tax=Streptomyces polyasparticus TaxID=2767826 RepID=A0ABR7SUJ4_9ACTN|nr:STAS domain-containing protein [Streptomyces polyasparticus]MBC9719073.1 STAS domain-containing protein [Streptomyces polyasparticus]
MIHGVRPVDEHLHTRQSHGYTVVELHGDIDIEAAMKIRPHLDAATRPPEIQIVIDLASVTFFDCSGIGLLCRARRRLTERGGGMLLVCPHPLTLRMLDILGLTVRFNPAPTLADALRTRASVRK